MQEHTTSVPDTAVGPLPLLAGGCCATHSDGTVSAAADSTQYDKWSRTVLHMAAVKADDKMRWAFIYVFLYLVGASTASRGVTSSSPAWWAPASTAVIAAWVQSFQALRELQATVMQGCWEYGRTGKEVWKDAWSLVKRKAP